MCTSTITYDSMSMSLQHIKLQNKPKNNIWVIKFEAGYLVRTIARHSHKLKGLGVLYLEEQDLPTKQHKKTSKHEHP